MRLAARRVVLARAPVVHFGDHRHIVRMIQLVALAARGRALQNHIGGSGVHENATITRLVRRAIVRVRAADVGLAEWHVAVPVTVRIEKEKS